MLNTYFIVLFCLFFALDFCWCYGFIFLYVSISDAITLFSFFCPFVDDHYYFIQRLFSSIFQLTRSRFFEFDWDHNSIIHNIKHEIFSDASLVIRKDRERECVDSNSLQLFFNIFSSRFYYSIQRIETKQICLCTIDIFREEKMKKWTFPEWKPLFYR